MAVKFNIWQNSDVVKMFPVKLRYIRRHTCNSFIDVWTHCTVLLLITTGTVIFYQPRVCRRVSVFVRPWRNLLFRHLLSWSDVYPSVCLSVLCLDFCQHESVTTVQDQLAKLVGRVTVWSSIPVYQTASSQLDIKGLLSPFAGEFQLLPSRQRDIVPWCRTKWYKNSFVPVAIMLEQHFAQMLEKQCLSI